MPVILAHDESCAIVVEGPVTVRDINQFEAVGVINECTCGGVYYRVNPNLGGVNFHRIKERPPAEPKA